MDFSLILIHGLVYCVLFTAGLLIIGLKSPRLMLQDYPKSIVDAAPPKTSIEKKQTIIYGLPFLINFIGYPFAIAWYYASQTDLTFAQIYSITWGITQIGNLFDLLILDWLIICFITPKMVVIPGTEGNKGYKDYLFHFKGFLKGLLITAVLSLILAGIVEFLT